MHIFGHVQTLDSFLPQPNQEALMSYSGVLLQGCRKEFFKWGRGAVLNVNF